MQKYFFPAPQWIALCSLTLESASADNPFKHSQNAQQCESKWHLTAARLFVLPSLILLLNYQPSNHVYKFWYLLKTMLKRGVKNLQMWENMDEWESGRELRLNIKNLTLCCRQNCWWTCHETRNGLGTICIAAEEGVLCHNNWVRCY